MFAQITMLVTTAALLFIAILWSNKGWTNLFIKFCYFVIFSCNLALVIKTFQILI